MGNLQFERAAQTHASEIQEKLGFSVGPSSDTVFESTTPLTVPEHAASSGLDRGAFEAIIEKVGRPSLLVRGGAFEAPASDLWATALNANKTKLEKAIASVGRVELDNHAVAWLGTAWMIAPNIAVTNRHIALQFTNPTGAGFELGKNPLGQQYRVYVNFRAEYLFPEVKRRAVKRVLYVAPLLDDQPDLAFLELEGADLPPPIPLHAGKLTINSAAKPKIAVIGYPAEDDRNNAVDMARIFEEVYDMKRLAPGEIDSANDQIFLHDASTLGGSSGSVVVDMETGAALGLHFAGEYLKHNFAVTGAVLSEYLKLAMGGAVNTPYAAPAEVSFDGAPAEAPQRLEQRQGYDAEFLGNGRLAVALPGLAKLETSVAPQLDGSKKPLHYANFSVVMHAARRVALFTATNIDGNLAYAIKRQGSEKWFYDPRMDKQFQVGNELYKNNELDRGHLTRRLDPAWGETRAAAAVGERDTFFWTNCSPQYSVFNQQIWLGLEDYVLENAIDSGLKVSVFTGPIFRGSDPSYRGVQIPRAFWKVLAVAGGGAPRATAYVISQADLISDLEFVYGQYETYQVPVAKISTLTRLDFSHLHGADPFVTEGRTARKLGTHRDIRL